MTVKLYIFRNLTYNFLGTETLNVDIGAQTRGKCNVDVIIRRHGDDSPVQLIDEVQGKYYKVHLRSNSAIGSMFECGAGQGAQNMKIVSHAGQAAPANINMREPAGKSPSPSQGWVNSTRVAKSKSPI